MMTFDDDLRAAGRRVLDSTPPAATASDLRGRRRRGRALGTAAVALVALAGGLGAVGPAALRPDVETDVVTEPELPDGRLELGAGPSVVTDADGAVLGELRVPEPVSRLERGGEVLPPDAAIPHDAEWVPLDDPVLDRVWHELLDDPVLADRLDDLGVADGWEARAEALAGAGLRVATTVDPHLQWVADAVVGEGTTPDGADAAVVAVEPTSGRIRVLRGPTLVARRQIGTLVQPIDLVAAREAGLPADAEVAAPPRLELPNPGAPGRWVVANRDGRSHGPLPLPQVLARGEHTPWVTLLVDGVLTPQAVGERSRALGLPAPETPYLSTLLGGFEAMPIDVATAYATFAAGGVRPATHVVDEVTGPGGLVLRSPRPAGERALDPDLAAEVREALAEVVCCGTGTAAQLPGDVPHIGQPGSTQDGADAWFAGSTPELTTVVWLGHDGERRPMRDGDGEKVTGSGRPAEIWRSIMASTLAGGEVGSFPAPPVDAGDGG